MRKQCGIWLMCLLLLCPGVTVHAADVATGSVVGETLDTEKTADEKKEANAGGQEETVSEPQQKTENAKNTSAGDTQKDEPKKDESKGAASTKDEDSKDAEGTDVPKSSISLKIDNQNVYEGMTRAYQNGYQPVVEKNRAMIVVPLLCDGKVKQDTLTATVDLGSTENSPFVYRTYEKSFKLEAATINGTKDTRDVFLISYALDLVKKRYNGLYPVTIQVKGTDEDGNEIEQSFASYVQITDGISGDAATGDAGGGSADGGAGTGEEKPTSAPIVLVSNSTLNTDIVKAGEDFEAVVTLKNTSKKKAVQNMVVTVNVPTAEFEVKNDANTIFVGSLGAGKTTDLTLKFHVSKSLADGNYPIAVAMSYDDPKANTLSSTGTFTVTVEQPLSVKLTMPVIQEEMTVGDTIPLTFQVMNLGRSTVYNVRCDVTGNGLEQTKTAFIGNMESGTAGEGAMNLFVTTMDGEQEYGDTTGTVTLSYEDSSGNTQTQEFTFDTSIAKKQTVSEDQSEEKPKSASQWWISILILAGIMAVTGCSAVAYYLGRKKR